MKKPKKKVKAIVLAAGKGTRMKSKIPKVLHKIKTTPMLRMVVNSIEKTGIKDIIVVVGYKENLVKLCLSDKPNIKLVKQKNQLGTADAVKQAKRFFRKLKDDVLIINGDTPLIKPTTLKRLIRKKNEEKTDCIILTCYVKSPNTYGRIIKNKRKNVVKITEYKDANVREKKIKEINAGVYIFSAKTLFKNISKISNKNKKKEYYLTDIIDILNKKGKIIKTVSVRDETEIIGVDTKEKLKIANESVKSI